MICIGIFLAFVLDGSQPRNPPKKMFHSENVIFQELRVSLVILVNKPLKALCLSFKMVYQHLLYLLSLWTY